MATTEKEIIAKGKKAARKWWNSEPNTLNNGLSEEFNKVKAKWAKHDYVCGYLAGWKANPAKWTDKEVEQVLAEWSVAIGKSWSIVDMQQWLQEYKQQKENGKDS